MAQCLHSSGMWANKRVNKRFSFAVLNESAKENQLHNYQLPLYVI